MQPNFQPKSFTFDTGVEVSITTDGVKAKANNGSANIEAKNLDNFTHIAYSVPKLSPMAMAGRVLLFGYILGFIVLYKVPCTWHALFFDASAGLIFLAWLPVIIFILSTILAGLIWWGFIFDTMLDGGIFDRITEKYFSKKSYRVTIGNKSGNNIEFIASSDELSKIESLEKKLNELKKHVGAKELAEKTTTQIVQGTNLDELKKLGELYQSGILNKEEFEKKKLELLNKA